MVFKNFLSKAKDIDILSSIPDGILLIDNAGRIEWINELAPVLFKMNKSDICKLNINEIIESGLDLVKQAAESMNSVVGRMKISKGKDIYFEITAKVAEDYYVASLRDVTQSYKIVTNIIVEHESSKKINKDKNNFLVKLSNELKSPIHSVIGFSQAMVDGLGGEMTEKQEKYITIINKNSNDLLYLINKIIDLAKTESTLFESDFQIFDVVNAFQSVIKDNEQAIKAKNLVLNTNFEELIKKTIYSDEAALKSALQNIFEAVINYTDIGSISVKFSHPDSELLSEKMLLPEGDIDEKAYLLITITDTGAGISEGDLNVIFEPYLLLDRPNKKNIVRSIALTCSRNLVKYLKGTIWIKSEVMQGTTCNIIIPVEKTMI